MFIFLVSLLSTMASIPNELLYPPSVVDEEKGAVIPSWQLDESKQSLNAIANSSILSLSFGVVGGLVAIAIVICIIILIVRCSDQLCGAPMSHHRDASRIYTAYNGLTDGILVTCIITSLVTKDIIIIFICKNWAKKSWPSSMRAKPLQSRQRQSRQRQSRQRQSRQRQSRHRQLGYLQRTRRRKQQHQKERGIQPDQNK